jgi:hypothetical protein
VTAFSALARDGMNLPIIDVTNPAFAVTVTDAELAEMSVRYVHESTQRKEVPAALREAVQRSKHRGLLVGRKIIIAVLDLDEAGPAFGIEAVNKLCMLGAPLSGLDINFQTFTYDWSEIAQLRHRY